MDRWNSHLIHTMRLYSHYESHEGLLSLFDTSGFLGSFSAYFASLSPVMMLISFQIYFPRKVTCNIKSFNLSTHIYVL